MKRAITDLPIKADTALIDGNKCPDILIPCQAIVKGDARSFSIAAASIVAKVTRDRIMARAHKRYPAYEIQRHKGYPTKAHREKLNDYGPAPIHRFSFGPVKDMR